MLGRQPLNRNMQKEISKVKIGAWHDDDGLTVTVWAPHHESLSFSIVDPEPRIIPMQRRGRGYFDCAIAGIEPGARYVFRFADGRERPDPVSHSQPDGVHGPSETIDHRAFSWTDDDWKGIELHRMVFYEIHVGTFTPEGSFEAVIPHLDRLLETGINTLNIMPVARFPGERNWGYDGVYPFAVQSSYGGPAGLKRLVDACHERSMAVFLDVVYNHLGPEGNYLAQFGPYFTDRYRSPWGDAVNFDGSGSDAVKNYFIENALYWLRDFHFDGLRLDAVHGMIDMSARPFLQMLSAEVDAFCRSDGRKRYLVAESDLNDVKILQDRGLGGYGIPAQWSDDFHHALHVLLTEESDGYYADFGGTGHLVKALTNGYVYDGVYSEHRGRSHGNASSDRPANNFVVCSQNHDQVGNRMKGERLITLTGFEKAKLAAAATILSPYIPLLFMGEDFGERAPFLYFVDHNDPGLIEAVREGRKNEFSSFAWGGEPPDPAAVETFGMSRVRGIIPGDEEREAMHRLYRDLLKVRSSHPALGTPAVGRPDLRAEADGRIVMVHRKEKNAESVLFLNFGEHATGILPAGSNSWMPRIDTADSRYLGSGDMSPAAAAGGDAVKLQRTSAQLFLKELIP